jgi:folate-binding protein YgfZ
LEGRGGALAQFALLGPEAVGVLTRAGADDPSDLPLFGWRSATFGDADVTVQRTEGVGSPGFVVLAPAPAAQAVRAAILRAGATLLTEDSYQVLRVEAGIPAAGSELTEDVTPLEAGLRRFCDDHKGCYTGQEVIARQITYDKVANHLVGLLPEAEVTARCALSAASGETSAGQGIGWVSSAAHSLALDRPIALAFLRRAFATPGTQVMVRIGEQPVPALVADLPFIQ